MAGRLLTIQYKELKLYADLAAEKTFAAERGGVRIVVEVKSFVGTSKLQDLKLALGQYDIYNSFLKVVAPERKLYVAISHAAYKGFFGKRGYTVDSQYSSTSVDR